MKVIKPIISCGCVPVPVQLVLPSLVHHSCSKQECANVLDCRYEQMKEAYEYDGLDTCAADGMCQEKCPVKVCGCLGNPASGLLSKETGSHFFISLAFCARALLLLLLAMHCPFLPATCLSDILENLHHHHHYL